MRELKFRVNTIDWDGIKGSFNVVDISWKPEEVSVVFINAAGDKEKKCVNYKDIVQYTGLKDKNGKEIYEGDILSAVKYGTDIPVGCNKWEVYYDKERLTFYQRNQENNRNPFWEFTLGSKQHVIVGNVYENPEIMKSV